MTPSITESQITTALGDFLNAILPASTAIVVGQVNRVAEPEGDYVVMWPLRRPMLGFPLDTAVDSKFTASISAGVMTVTAFDPILNGAIKAGSAISGVNVASNTTVASLGTGTGGVGTYNVTPSQTASSETMSAGRVDILQSTEIVFQIDVHGPSSAENAQTITTLFRDASAVDLLSSEAITITPFYADDPRQVPFETAADQYEDRWIVEAHLQVDPIVSIPAQFADAVTVTPVVIDVAFPPQ